MVFKLLREVIAKPSGLRGYLEKVDTMRPTWLMRDVRVRIRIRIDEKVDSWRMDCSNVKYYD